MGGGGGELFTCPYPLKIQARPPREQRLATQSRVSGREGKEGAIVIFKQLRSMSGRFKKSKKLIYLFKSGSWLAWQVGDGFKGRCDAILKPPLDPAVC